MTQLTVTVLVCRNCRQGVVVIEEQWVGDQPKRLKPTTGGLISYRGLQWWPLPVATTSSDVPAAIADAFAEAARALAANCPRAAAVMARRTLEAITADKGASQGRLVDRLAALVAKGVLQPVLAEWAKEVRLIGNEGAHFDAMANVSQQDAQQLVSFIRELLRYLYELPKELDRLRQANAPQNP